MRATASDGTRSPKGIVSVCLRWLFSCLQNLLSTAREQLEGALIPEKL